MPTFRQNDEANCCACINIYRDSTMSHRPLCSLRGGFRLFAFSNGKRSEIDAVLSNANILDCFEGIVTADDVRSFKPDPAVYSYARRVTGAWSSPFWLVSSNPWDIIGARSAGLSAAWVQRSEAKIYDPWGIEPEVTVRSLVDLPAMLGDGAMLSENPVNDRNDFQSGTRETLTC